MTVSSGEQRLKFDLELFHVDFRFEDRTVNKVYTVQRMSGAGKIWIRFQIFDEKKNGNFIES